MAALPAGSPFPARSRARAPRLRSTRPADRKLAERRYAPHPRRLGPPYQRSAEPWGSSSFSSWQPRKRIALPYAFASANPLRFALDPRWVEDLRRPRRVDRARSPGSRPISSGPGARLDLRCGTSSSGDLSVLRPARAGGRRRCGRVLAPPGGMAAGAAPPLHHAGIRLPRLHDGEVHALPLPVLSGAGDLCGAVAAPLVARRDDDGRSFLEASRRGDVHRRHLCLWDWRSVDLRQANTRALRPRVDLRAHPPGRRSATKPGTTALPMPSRRDVGGYAARSSRCSIRTTPRKVDELVDALTKSDWVAVTSGRVYVNVTRSRRVPDDDRVLPRALRRQPRLRARGGLHLLSVARAAPVPDDGAEERSRSTTIRACCSSARNRFSPERVRGILLGRMPPRLPR